MQPPEEVVGRTIGPYQILAELGGGGMGTVYRARDSVLGRFVAVKVLRPDREGRAALDRFFREARAASALNHPNIVTIHEIGEAEGISYIVMELVEGKTLRSMIGATAPLEFLIEIAAQTAKALSVAHAAGIVHRDIKPENVMVRPDGYVKVLDFGLARQVISEENRVGKTASGLTSPGTIVGTVQYMSPEQAKAQPVSGASDVFSLGVVLYELTTEKHPFLGSTRLAMLQAILTEAPTPPSRLQPAIPGDIEALILAMLEKDQRRRPTAAEVYRSLTERPARVRPAVDVHQTISHAVGRAHERQELQRAFGEAAAGRGSMMCVAGEAGLGKTTLVEDFLVRVTGCTIARGRCSERLAGAEAYLPVFEALSSLLQSDSGGSAVRVMRNAAPNWFLQVGSWSAEGSAARMEAESNAAASQERMKREMAAFLDDLSKVRPVVLFLEDLHWADISTVDLLGYLGTKCASARMLIVTTYRPSDLLLAKHPFRRVKLELQGRGVAKEIMLGFLSRESLDEYLQLQFPDHQFPPEFAELIHAKTEGHPLFMTDLLRDLRSRGVLAQQKGHWVLAQTVTAIEPELPESTRSMIERKIDQLCEEDRRLLGAAAVQGHEFDSAVVAQAADAEPDEVEERLDELDRLHALVRRTREREFPDGTLSIGYRFAHVLYQNALLDRLSASRRTRLSLAVGRTLETLHSADRDEAASQLAFLFEAGRDFDLASQYYLTAARQATRVFANQEVVLLARRGLACLQRRPGEPKPDRELALQLLLGSSLMATRGFGDEDVLKTYRRARELCQQQELTTLQPAAVRGLWAFHFVRTEYTTALELAQQLMELARRTGDPNALIEAHLAFGFTFSHIGQATAAAEHLQAGIAVDDPNRPPDRSHMFALDPGVGCRFQLGVQLWYLGYPDQGLRFSREAVALARKKGYPYSTGIALVSLAVTHALRGELADQYEQAEAAIALAREHGLKEVLGWATIRLGWAMVRQGRIEEGLAAIRQWLGAQQAIGSRHGGTHFLAVLAESLLVAGKLDEGAAVITEALELARSSGAGYYEPELNRLQGEILLAQGGSPELAEACFRLAVHLAARNQMKAWELRAATCLCRLLARLGKSEEGCTILAPVYGWFSEGLETGDLREAAALLSQGIAA